MKDRKGDMMENGWTKEISRLRAENAELRHELKLNASMLARQCDLARDAETSESHLRQQVECQVPIFSGDYSRDMWGLINTSESKRDLRDALHLICCRLQELESRMNQDR